MDPVQITLKDVYDVVVRLDRANIPQRVDDHEKRIRALEKYVWAWAGGAALTGGVMGQFLNLAMGG
jgi:hypothetical protein